MGGNTTFKIKRVQVQVNFGFYSELMKEYLGVGIKMQTYILNKNLQKCSYSYCRVMYFQNLLKFLCKGHAIV
jgi:hypothetical protein